MGLTTGRHHPVVSRILGLRVYFGRFAVVGIIGIGVNQGFLALFNLVMGIPVEISGVLSIEISIISNFLLNNYWTWQDRTEQSFWTKFVKYHLVTLFSGLVNYLVLIVLSHSGMHVLVANLFGIGLGSMVNFTLNHFWTFED